MSTKIFRKVALERLSSPEQLDQLLQVTHPRGWLALGALGALLIAALVWGFFGSIPTVAAGEGILLRQGGVSNVVATGQGQVEEILVSVGQSVAKDEVVARVRQEALLRQIQETEDRLEDQKQENERLRQLADERLRLTARNLQQQRVNLDRSIETLEIEISLIQERLDAEQELLRDGLVTKQTVLASEQALNAARDRRDRLQQELAGLDLTRLETRQSLDQQQEAAENRRRDLQLEIRELEARLEEESAIRSPFAGRILELAVDRGDVVAPGTSLLSLELTSEELMAVLFIPADTGKKVQPGMKVQVAPSMVKREEYGFIYGEVTWVAEFPSTARGMLRLLANQELVTRLLGQGPPIQVDVRLQTAADSPTGYAWSSGEGPNLAITSGTLATGSVIAEQKRPISLVIPEIKSRMGL